MGPRAIPEEWVRDDKVVHYLIPKTFVDWLTPKFGETGIYSLLTMGTLALASKEYLVFHIETKIAIEFFVTWSLLNMLFGDSVREMAADQFTASYDRLYAVKEHDIEAYGEIVEQYKEAQMQAQGQALFNQQIAIEAALADQEARHMINWIETEVQNELAQLDQDEQIQVCVDQLKALKFIILIYCIEV